MASSSIRKSFKYEVFLSFRGEDTRKNIVNLLYNALQNQAIDTYKDDEKITKGEKIDQQLVRSIKESRLYIIVFSKNYASSSWCLDELLTIMECQDMPEHTAFPLFFDVEPTEVRKQIGEVKLALEKAAKNKSAEIVKGWKDALEKAAGLAGWELKNTFDGRYHEFIQKVVQDISIRLHFTDFRVDKNLVDMETRVDRVIRYLDINSEDVRMVAIKGMGGAGKTTLVEAVFYEMAILFEGKCFVDKVRERSKSLGFRELQKQVLISVINDKVVVENDFVGKQAMKRRMSGRKVLLVLDDVDDVEQLQELAGETDWFKAGSRIIFTTRDERVLEAHKKNFAANFTYDINDSLLLGKDAICLFSRYAFGGEKPDLGYEELSKEVVEYAAGLPLTLRVLGSDLCGRSKPEWEESIKRLKTFPEKKTLEILELSYIGLKDDHKEIFLDVACILKGERKDIAVRVLESCGFQAELGLATLKEKSLITISNDDRLLMHDRLEEMGRNIVCRRYPKDPRRHSRLWDQGKIEHVLENDLGTEDTLSIKLLNTHLNPSVIMNGLKNMKKLMFIYLDGEHKSAEYASPSSYNNDGLPNALQYLYWRNYPFRYLPKTFRGSMLVNLEMVGGNIRQLWEDGERKDLTRLKYVDLRDSDLRTFDLRMTPCLETLNLKGCKDFVELRMPIKCENLKFLNLGGSKVSNLNFEVTPNLEKLTLSMTKIRHLPDNICKLKRLRSLKLESCWLLEQLPEGLGELHCLEKLILTEGTVLQDIPSSICKMKRLECLRLPYVGVKNLPEELGSLTCLKELNLEGASISDIPRSVLVKKGLCLVGDKELLESYGFTSFTEITEYTASCYV